jgi:hypothetical protein
MFSKSIISLAFLFITLLGLILAIRDQQYVVFSIGLIGYFLMAISSSLCKGISKLRAPH